jgi:hypothetical protein
MQEYGLRCVLQVAAQKSDGPVTVRDIAQKEALTPMYVAKILNTLRRANLAGTGSAGRLRKFPWRRRWQLLGPWKRAGITARGFRARKRNAPISRIAAFGRFFLCCLNTSMIS